MPDLIKVMISSRCDDHIKADASNNNDTIEFSELRQEIKKAVEAEKLFDRQIFEVWINEDASPPAGDKSATDVCLDQVVEADILIVLYNGNAGGAETDEDIGFCHAELERAWDTEPSKIRIIKILPLCKPEESATGHNRRFMDYVDSLKRFRGKADNAEDAKKVVLKTLHEAVIEMVKREAMEGQYHLGPALVWSLLDFAGRKKVMEEVIRVYFGERKGTEQLPPNLLGLDEEKISCARYIKIKDKKVLALFHAIPSSMSIATAREMVGRPFYRDYEYAVALTNDIIGPIHFIGCHRNVTETQVRNLVGQPDIVLITAPFGVYMLDKVQHTQIVFLAGCRDDTCTRGALGRFFEWLTLSEKSPEIIENAESRKKIVSAIHSEYPSEEKAVSQSSVPSP